MKKAKEYYAELKPIFDSEDMGAIKKAASDAVTEMVSVEIPDLAKSRNVKYESSLKAIENEVNRKWNALCDRCEANGYSYLKKDAVTNLCKTVWEKM